MNEPVIRESNPETSPILAYGTVSERPRNAIIIAAIVGVVVAFAIGFIAFAYTSPRLPVPETTSLLAYLRPSTRLPDTAPDVWRHAQEEAAPLPSIVGYTQSEGGQLPFAIVPHLLAPWKFDLRSKGALSNISLVSPSSLVGSASDYGAPAWLRLWPGNAFSPLNASRSSDESVGGAVREKTWITDVDAPQDAALTDLRGTNALSLKAAPTAWPVIQRAFQYHGITLPLQEIPQSVHWTDTPDGAFTALFVFTEKPSVETRTTLAAAVGFTDKHPYTLNDGTIAYEFVPPKESIGIKDDGEFTNPEGGRIRFDGNTVILGNPDLLKAEATVPTACTGHVLAFLEEKTIRGALEASGFPMSIRIPDRMYLTEHLGKLVFCW